MLSEEEKAGISLGNPSLKAFGLYASYLHPYTLKVNQMPRKVCEGDNWELLYLWPSCESYHKCGLWSPPDGSPLFLQAAPQLLILCLDALCACFGQVSVACGIFSCGTKLLAGHVGSSSLTKDQTYSTALGAWCLSHWNSREVPRCFLIRADFHLHIGV